MSENLEVKTSDIENPEVSGGEEIVINHLQLGAFGAGALLLGVAASLSFGPAVGAGFCGFALMMVMFGHAFGATLRVQGLREKVAFGYVAVVAAIIGGASLILPFAL